MNHAERVSRAKTARIYGLFHTSAQQVRKGVSTHQSQHGEQRREATRVRPAAVIYVLAVGGYRLDPHVSHRLDPKMCV